MTETIRERTPPRGDHRILYVSDPSTVARTFLPDPVQEQDLRRWVDMVADSGVDLFDQEVFSQGWTAYWQSDHYQYDQRHQHKRFLPLLKTGIQPLEVIIDQAHRRDMGFVAGFRINDGHAYQAREQGLDIAEFIASHPELQLTDLPEGTHYEQTEPLDFTFEEVRAFTSGVIQEVADRFDIDGVEICFRDCAYFPQGRGPERASLMTDMVQNIRGLLNKRSATGGKHILLGARVHPTVAECASLGLDVPTWIRERLIDYVSPQDTMYADYNLPYEEWAALTRDSDCLMYPGMLPWTSIRARYRRKRIPLSPANSRALAQTMYRAGADGLSVYNHFVPGLWTPPFYPQAMRVFHQLRDPDRVSQGERHYIFDPTWAGQTGFGGEGRCSSGVVKVNQLLLDRSQPGATDEYRFNLFEDLQDTHGATLLFRGHGLTENDGLSVRLNGHPIPDDTIHRAGQSDAQPVDQNFVREEDGRQIPSFPEQGWFDFCPDPPRVFSTRWFSLLPDTVVYGENCLSVTLTRSDPGARQPVIGIDELEIFVEP